MGEPSRHLIITFILSLIVFVSIILINVSVTSHILSITGDESFLSDLGIILWCVTASICFFSAKLIKRRHAIKHQFLIYSAFLSTYLLFDDFFELHEHYIPNLLSIDEKIIYIILGLATLVLIIRFYKVILQTNYIIMVMAVTFFAMSIAADGILNPIEIVYGTLLIVGTSFIIFYKYSRAILKEYLLIFIILTVSLYIAFLILPTNDEYSEYIFEEGSKWIGIASWCSYYVHTAHNFVISSYLKANE
jgi:hypothetical protein